MNVVLHIRLSRDAVTDEVSAAEQAVLAGRILHRYGPPTAVYLEPPQDPPSHRPRRRATVARRRWAGRWSR